MTMKFELEGIITSAFDSRKSAGTVYLDVLGSDGSQFNLTVRETTAVQFANYTMKPVKLVGVMKGRVFQNEGGKRQVLEAVGLKVSDKLPA